MAANAEAPPAFFDLRCTVSGRIQSWVFEVDGLIVVVDTGGGNDRDRPAMPPLDHLDTDFLGRFNAPASTAKP